MLYSFTQAPGTAFYKLITPDYSNALYIQSSKHKAKCNSQNVHPRRGSIVKGFAF